MTDTQPTHDQLVIAHRDWVGPVLRLEPQAAHEFLTVCSDEELQAIAALQTAGADKRTKRDAIKTIYSAVHERNMTRQPEPPAPAPTPETEAPAAEPAAHETKPTRRTVKQGS